FSEIFFLAKTFLDLSLVFFSALSFFLRSFPLVFASLSLSFALSFFFLSDFLDRPDVTPDQSGIELLTLTSMGSVPEKMSPSSRSESSVIFFLDDQLVLSSS